MAPKLPQHAPPDGPKIAQDGSLAGLFASPGALEPFLDALGPFLTTLGANLAPSWPQLGPFSEPKTEPR